MKILILRLSSFGDIVQTLVVPNLLKIQFPNAEIHWVVRSDLASIVELSPFVDKIWQVDRKKGIRGLFVLAKSLPQFTHIYDAHNNLRTGLLSRILKAPHFIRRSKQRWNRFFQFRLGLRVFKMPFIGAKSFVDPLGPWGLSWSPPVRPSLKIDDSILAELRTTYGLKEPYVTLVPSAAWPMKRWPETHWKELISSLEGWNVVCLGGPEDGFIETLTEGSQAINLAGRLSLKQSLAVLSGSRAVVSADTGLLHAADAMMIPSIALIGPTAFGYPAQNSSRVLEVNLPCKPCSKDGRGRCKNTVYQKCMKDIDVIAVTRALRQMGAVIQ